MKKLAVIGTGYVGLVSGTCFAEIGNQVICCDIDHSKIDKLNRGEVPIYEPGLKELIDKNVSAGRLNFTTNVSEAVQAADIIYIAVGTPMSASGEADLTYVWQVAETIAKNMNDYKIIVTKSTVPVGTGKRIQQIIKEKTVNPQVEFDIVSNPEFLREGSAIHDTMNMERAVIGATSEKAVQIIKELHAPFNTTVLVTDVETAEMIKYASNAFLATKISFINDIANICERVGADVTKVAAGMGLDSRIGAQFLKAGIGYGGSCFPKDTQALIHTAETVGYDFQLLKSVVQTNKLQRKKMIQKCIEVIGDLQNKEIAVLGLAFKPNTDDMRDAPALDIIPELLKMGAVIKAFDPVAVSEAKKLLKGDIEYFTDLYHTVTDSDACVILTDWPHVLQMDLAKVKSLMKTPVVIDGRNCFDLDQMRHAGFLYHSIGRKPVVPKNVSLSSTL